MKHSRGWTTLAFSVPIDLGIDFEGKAFYDILKAIAEKNKFEYAHDKLLKLSQEIKKIINDKARYTDWSHRKDIKAELKSRFDFNTC